MDPEKIKAIIEWKALETIKQLQQFLGFYNFYQRFIKGCSSVTRPLTHLLQKYLNWDWPDDQVNAFVKLKRRFTQAPILAHFYYQNRTFVEIDASNWASGAVLFQTGTDGLKHPVAYFSSKHSPAESNCDIYDKELLAIIKFLEEWRPELSGLQEPFEIVTDHRNLKTFMTAKQLNQRQVRSSEFLSEFNFTISYRPGSKALLSDTLSRLPGLKPQDISDERLRNRFRPFIAPHNWLERMKSIHYPDDNHNESIAIMSPETALIDLIVGRNLILYG